SPVDDNSEMFAIHDLSDIAQPILPTLRNSRWVQRRNIKLKTRGRKVDADPIKRAGSLRGALKPLTSVLDAGKYFDRRPWPKANFARRAAAEQPSKPESDHQSK